METIIKVTKKITPKNPIMIVGLPGFGSTGILVAEHLIKQFKAERFATLYSPHLPHKVIMEKNGELRIVDNRFYYIKSNKQTKNDIIILTGDDQAFTSEGQYELNTKILDFFVNALNGKFIYTVGGYNNVSPYNSTSIKESKVFGNATDQKVVKMFKGDKVIFGESEGFILGSAGMIVAFAKMRNIPGICLMGESRAIDVDPASAKKVLEVLSKKMHLNIDMTSIDSMIEEVSKTLHKIESELNTNVPIPPGGYPKTDEHSSYIR